MREIKFRAWDLVQERMRDWDDVTTAWSFRELNKHTTQVWLQYTGLKDKKGKEIYDGDLFHCIYHRDGCIEHELQVVWHEAGFRLKRVGGDCHQWGVRQELRDVARYEIIGNIYENAELLTSR